MNSSVVSYLFVAGSVLIKVFLICLLGAVMVRRKIIDETFLQGLSKLLLWLFLPSLLFTNLSKNFNIHQVQELWVLPISAALYILCGFLFSFVLRRFFVKEVANYRIFVAAASLLNAGYLPMMLLVSLVEFTKALREIPDASQKGIAFISVSLLGVTPMLWGVTYPYLSEKPWSIELIRKILNPPFVAILSGLLIALIPGWQSILWNQRYPFYILMSSLESIGTLALPCAMLVLGGTLAYGPEKGLVSTPTIVGVGLIRFILVPLMACGWFWFLTKIGIEITDPLIYIVLLVEAAMPPATNLVVITYTVERGTKVMATILFWLYLVSLFFLAGYIALILYFFLPLNLK